MENTSSPWKYLLFGLIGVTAILGLTFLSKPASSQDLPECTSASYVAEQMKGDATVKYNYATEEVNALKEALINLEVVNPSLKMTFEYVEIWEGTDPSIESYIVILYEKGCMSAYFSEPKEVGDALEAEVRQHLVVD